MSRGLGSDDVGFGKPPKQYRFQKGKSGNPHGRPRQSGVLTHPITTAIERELLRQLSEEVVVATKDGAKKMNKEAVLVSKLLKLAFEDNVACLKLALQIGAGAQTKLVQEAVISVEEALRYKRRCAEVISDCAAEGKTPPEFLPHPDDMVVGIDHVDFVGPMTETQQAAMMLVIKERDEILEVIPEYVRLAPEHEHGGPFYLAYLEALKALRQCNVSLPPRLRKEFVERPLLLQWRNPPMGRGNGEDDQAPA